MALNKEQRIAAIDALEEAVLSNLAERLKREDAPSSDFTLAWNICKDAGVLASFERGRSNVGFLEEYPPMEDLEELSEVNA